MSQLTEPVEGRAAVTDHFRELFFQFPITIISFHDQLAEQGIISPSDEKLLKEIQNEQKENPN